LAEKGKEKRAGRKGKRISGTRVSVRLPHRANEEAFEGEQGRQKRVSDRVLPLFPPGRKEYDSSSPFFPTFIKSIAQGLPKVDCRKSDGVGRVRMMGSGRNWRIR